MHLKCSSKNRSLYLLNLYMLMVFSFQYQLANSQDKTNINSRDISYLSSGGKLLPLQAIMYIRH